MSAAATLTCVKCQAAIPIPAELTRTLGGSLACPACGQRYTRRVPGAAGATRPPQAPPAGTNPRSAAASLAHDRTPPSGPTHPLPLMTGGAAGATAPPIFEDGLVVAGRYRILRFLARGGMGEVYEAEDAELRERVALKTVHPSVASEEGAIERFKREIHLARKVTHPNVCRIFDVGYHAAADRAPTVFLTMELLEGETLSARLKRRGRLTTEEALPIARQAAAALAAAHGAGVVHRDFKCENVFLVPRGPDAIGERVVVTDFGIARGGADDSFALTLTSVGGVVGTPAYMAPEQVAGEPVTAAVDQYALGVVLYEMVTGELPFKGESPIATAAKRLTETPPSPAARLPGLDPAWSATIERALARHPAARFSSVAALVDALEGRPTVPAAALPQAPAPARAPAEKRKRWLAALLLLALAATSVWAWVRIQRLRDEGRIVRPQAARRTVAVIGFRNLSGREESAWLSTALAEMLATEIAQGGELRVIPGDAVAQALVELGRPEGETLSAQERERLRARLGADYLVLGGYTALPGGGPLRLDLRLVDTRRAEPVATLAETGAAEELFTLVAQAGVDLRAGMGVAAGGSGRSLLPASPEAARLYAEGLDALRGFEPQRARELLARAVELDPDNALVRSALSLAWGALGYGERAAAEARQAYERASALPDPERSIIEARYYESTGEWGRAAEIWQALWQAAPDSLDHGLAVARARTRAGAADTALEVIAALRTLSPAEGEDPRLDLAEATAASARGDFARQAEAAGRAAERAEAIGARLIAAEALVSRAWALRNLGEGDAALAAADRARELAVAAGDRGRAASALSVAAGVALDRGELDAARSAYQQAQATAKATGDLAGSALALNNLAVVERRSGELAAARAHYEEAEAIALEIGDRRGAAYSGSNVAAMLAEGGDLEGAEGRLVTALASFRELGDPAGTASTLASLGGLRRRSGDLAAARAALEESIALRRSIGQRAGEAGSLAALAQTFLDGGDLDGAEARFDEALALARQLGDRGAEAAALTGLGDLHAARGDVAAGGARLTEALVLRRATGERAAAERIKITLARLDVERSPEASARTAAAALAALGPAPPPESEAAARAVQARAALARGKSVEARAALEPMLARLGELGLEPRLELRMLAARAGAASERGRAAAFTELGEVAAAAATAGLLPLELEARITAAGLGGTGVAAQAATLAARARAAGLLPLAARAERAAN